MTFSFLDKPVDGNAAPATEGAAVGNYDDSPEPASACSKDADCLPEDKDVLRFGARPIVLKEIPVYPHIIERPQADGKPPNYDIFQFGPIGAYNRAEALALQDFVQVVSNAAEGSTVTIYVDTPGGVVSDALRMTAAMHRSKAHIVTCAIGMVASAGTVLWAAGDEKRISDHAAFMFHFSSHGDGGSSLAVADNATVLVEHVKTHLLAPMLDAGYITEEEMDLILRREDVFIDAAAMRKRIEKGD